MEEEKDQKEALEEFRKYIEQQVEKFLNESTGGFFKEILELAKYGVIKTIRVPEFEKHHEDIKNPLLSELCSFIICPDIFE